MTIQERFDKFWMPEPNSGCWLWIGSLAGRMKYGLLADRTSRLPAHRVSWVLHRGNIPDGMCVLHHCDTPSCVNPDHLFLGSKRDNNTDRDKKGRQRTPKGESNPRCKLTENQVREIISDCRTHRLIALDYGVGEKAIWQIKNRKTWLHLAMSQTKEKE